MLAVFILVCFALFEPCMGAWYFKENVACDPGRDNVLPFTGFTINRKFKLQGLGVPVSQNFLTISFCNHGKVEYEKMVKLDNSIDINWNRPFCILKQPPSHGLLNRHIFLSPINSNSTSGVSLSPKLVFDLGISVGDFKKKLEHVAEKVTDGALVQYTGKSTHDHIEGLKDTDPQSSLAWESKNLVCFKMARRQKYAKRNITFYIPNTFVGGLFECPIPTEKRLQVMQALNGDKLVQPLEFDCDPSLAKPILPLIAADSTKRWFDYDILRNPFNPAVIQTIPYLTTPTVLNMRFSAIESSAMYKDSWAGKIDVNENYVYLKTDLDLIEKAFTLSADYLNKLISPKQIPPMLFQFNLGLKQLGSPNNFLTSSFNSLGIQDKISLFFSYKNTDYVKHHLKTLQSIWDDRVKG